MANMSEDYPVNVPYKSYRLKQSVLQEKIRQNEMPKKRQNLLVVFVLDATQYGHVHSKDVRPIKAP